MGLGHTRRCRWAFRVALLCAVFLVFAIPSKAQRIIFSRGGVLYSAAENGSDPRRLFTLGGKAPDTFWAASPDGRRVAWATRAAAKPGENGQNNLAARPVIVYVAELLNAGLRRKRLFSTDTLKDRQGKPVSAVGVPPGGGASVGGGFKEWEPVSLSWSADSRTLYLSCVYWTADPVRETTRSKGAYGIDAATGAALVNAEGRWKLIAPMTHIEARGGLLVGSGIGRLPEDSGEGFAHYYEPLVVVNLVEGNRAALFSASPTQTRDNLPPYGTAYHPALAPQNRAIAFVAAGQSSEAGGQGVWTVDKFGKMYQRIIEGEVRRPRWSSDGARLLFLRPRSSGTHGIFDLYQINAPKDSASPSGAPRLVLQSVDWFDTVPD